MTKRKHLKQRIRARMAKTGESYTAARAQLRGRPAVLVEEEVDLGRQAEAAGLACAAWATPALAAALGEAGLAEALARLRALAEVCRTAPGGASFRDALVLGQPLPPLRADAELAELRRFLVGVRAGVRGVSGSGRCAALEVGGRPVVALCLSAPGRRPSLWLCPLEGLGSRLTLGVGPTWALALGGLGWVAPGLKGQ